MNAAEQGKRERAASLFRPGQLFARLYARYHRAAKTVGILCASDTVQSTGGLEWEEFGCNETVPTGTIVVATSSGQIERIATDTSRFR